MCIAHYSKYALICCLFIMTNLYKIIVTVTNKQLNEGFKRVHTIKLIVRKEQKGFATNYMREIRNAIRNSTLYNKVYHISFNYWFSLTIQNTLS